MNTKDTGTFCRLNDTQRDIDLEPELREIISLILGIESEEVHSDLRILSIGDELDIALICIQVYSELGIRIDPLDVDAIVTVGDIYEFVRRHCQKQSVLGSEVHKGSPS